MKIAIKEEDEEEDGTENENEDQEAIFSIVGIKDHIELRISKLTRFFSNKHENHSRDYRDQAKKRLKGLISLLSLHLLINL